MFEGFSTTQIIVLIVMHVFFVGFVAYLIIRKVKKYYVGEEVSGDVVWTLEKSSKRAFGFLITSVVCICIWGSNLFRMTNIFSVITTGMLLIEVVCIAVLGMLPQKVCVNGIITQNGFIEWAMIRKVLESKKEDIVLLKLKRQVDNEIPVYCQKAERDKLENYIWERIGLE